LSQQMPVDAIYLDLHGAMVTEDFQDGEGELLRRIRACVGADMPIVISLDYHANVTPAMAAQVDAVSGYLTYPHVDRPETGIRAAAAMQHVLEHGRTPGCALRKMPFLIPLHSQCTMVEPSRSIVELTQSLEGEGVLTVSYLAGFPPSDIFDCGPSVVVHAATQEAADRAADEVARFVAMKESEFAVPVLSPADAVSRAMSIAAGADRPVIIADTQDNPGAGGSADTTGLLFALVEGQPGLVRFTMLDAPAIDDELVQRLLTLISEFSVMATAHLDNGVRRGFLHAGLDTRIAGEGLLSLMMYSVVPTLRRPLTEAERRRLAEALVGFAFNGIAGRP